LVRIERCDDVAVLNGLHGVVACGLILREMHSITNVIALSKLRTSGIGIVIEECPSLVGLSCIGRDAKVPLSLGRLALLGNNGEVADLAVLLARLDGFTVLENILPRDQAMVGSIVLAHAAQRAHHERAVGAIADVRASLGI
jgi:hypothetical protein